MTDIIALPKNKWHSKLWKFIIYRMPNQGQNCVNGWYRTMKRKKMLGSRETWQTYGWRYFLVYWCCRRSPMLRLDRQYHQENSRWCNSPETLSQKTGNNWSELNKERCRRLERSGLMTDAGRVVLPDMSPNGFTIDKDILRRLQSDPTVWNNFCQFPDLYRRIRIDTIQIMKNQPEIFESRLNKFIENTRKGLLYGEWNDNGRL